MACNQSRTTEYSSASFVGQDPALRTLVGLEQGNNLTHRMRITAGTLADGRRRMAIAFNTRPRSEPEAHRSPTSRTSLRRTVIQRSCIRQSQWKRVRMFAVDATPSHELKSVRNSKKGSSLTRSSNIEVKN